MRSKGFFFSEDLCFHLLNIPPCLKMRNFIVTKYPLTAFEWFTFLSVVQN